MKNFAKCLIPYLLSLILFFLMSSCEVVGGIFKAGAYTGIIVVLLVVFLVIWAGSRLFGGRRRL
ncbi:hypothetical protein [Nibrella saemangeumensis]|uniref:hypothetical protein n=1 Tax=Nibrella saemangeumensis TaxID=1084526 RepID=UPI0031EF0C8E